MMTDTANKDRERLDFDALIAEGLSTEDAHAVLQGATCITWQEAADRWAMLQRERGVDHDRDYR